MLEKCVYSNGYILLENYYILFLSKSAKKNARKSVVLF